MLIVIKSGLGFELGLRKRGDRWGRLENISEANSSSSSSTASDDVESSMARSQLTDYDFDNEDMSKPSESVHNNRNKNDSAVLESNDKKSSDEPKLMYLCYSMYTPWVTNAVMTVHKAASQFDRMKVRQKTLTRRKPPNL